MKHILKTVLAIAGLIGGSRAIGATPPFIPSDLNKMALVPTPSATPPLKWETKDRGVRGYGSLDKSPAKNQRIKRKNQRRAWASGNKKAFA